MFDFFKKAFGTQSDREYKKATDVLSHVNQFANQASPAAHEMTTSSEI